MPSKRSRFTLISLICLTLALGFGCASPLVPEPRLPRISRQKLPDAALLDELRADWEMLQLVKMSDAERQELITRYNARLLMLLRRVRHDVLHERAGMPTDIAITHDGMPMRRPLQDIYDDIVPAADVPTDSLEERYTLPGVGVPLVGVIPASKIRPSDRLATFQARGTVSTLTALLEFPKQRGAKPTLRLIPRHWNERIRIGRLSYPLAGDFSAPIEIYWNLTGIKKGRFLGLLHPQQLRDTTGLSCMEQYNPDKIPVILAHGLASSAQTFNNFVNRLLRDPEIRRNYQFWYFNYPTGVAWPLTAADYRQALKQARDHFDPAHRNRNWERMVVIGHSMGGLITHISQAVPQQAQLPQHEDALPAELRKALHDFTPVRAGRVIYMATPHRGAPVAKNRFVLLLTRLIELPQTLVEEVFTLATLQQDNALTNPRRLTEWFTSIGQLSPESYSIRALAGMPVRDVPTHSVIGDRNRHDSPHSTDGIVPYWSSHLPWGTESIVPADHSVQDVPESAVDVMRILKKHLRK